MKQDIGIYLFYGDRVQIVDIISGGRVLPKLIFTDGKTNNVTKDPSTGEIKYSWPTSSVTSLETRDYIVHLLVEDHNLWSSPSAKRKLFIVEPNTKINFEKKRGINGYIEKGSARDDRNFENPSLDRAENHLNYNPWLRGIYDEAKNIAALDPLTVLQDGLNEDDLYDRVKAITYGDFRYSYRYIYVENNDADAIPGAYFNFLFLIGGFSCRSVRLYHLGKEYIDSEYYKNDNSKIANVSGPCVREKVIRNESEAYPIQLTLGVCDHGDYVYDRRYDSYSLVNPEHTSNFDNCDAMLYHAMYRARENIKDNWKASK